MPLIFVLFVAFCVTYPHLLLVIACILAMIVLVAMMYQ